MSKRRTSPVEPNRETGDVSFPHMTETIGQQLKHAREAKNLSIEKVVLATRIRAYQIEAIEADDFESMPSPVQARAFLRLYAEFLGLSLDDIIAHQRSVMGETGIATSDSATALKEQELTSPVTVKETSPVDTQRASGKLKKFINRIKKVITRSGDKPATSEPEEESNPSEPIKADEKNTPTEPVKTGSEEPDLPLEEDHASETDILPSQVIFTAIGKTLRQRRESLSLTLDEIEKNTHVRKHYLQELEAGEFGKLPSSVQARGMVNNYAHFLNLDIDAVLLSFAEGLQARRLERQPKPEETSQKPASKKSFTINLPFKIQIPPTVRRYLSVDIFVGGGLVLLLLTFATWGTSRIVDLRAGSTAQPTAPSISNILVSTGEAATETPTPTATGNGNITPIPVEEETLVMTLPAAGHGPVQIIVIASEQAYLRVSVDGKVEFEGRVTAGAAYPFDGNTQIEVLTGNGRAISIMYNQNNMGPMGNYGEVVDRIYTANAILIPTATNTPTPSITPTPTITLKPSATLRPSSTPRISPTPGQ